MKNMGIKSLLIGVLAAGLIACAGSKQSIRTDLPPDYTVDWDGNFTVFPLDVEIVNGPFLPMGFPPPFFYDTNSTIKKSNREKERKDKKN